MTALTPNRRHRLFAGAALLVSALLPLGAAAQQAECKNPRKAAGTMTESFYRGIEQATKLMSENKFDDAISRLAKIAESGSEYEKAVANYNLGFAYNSKNDIGNAIKAFRKALDANALPQVQHDSLMFNTGQLYVINKQVDEGIRTLERFMAESCAPPNADAHIFLASAYTDRKRFRDALAQVDVAISKAKQPKESWLQLKLGINYELKDYPACAQTLIQLIGMAPAKPDYWKQLSSMFFEMKEDAESVAVLALAERQGFVEKPTEIKNLYNIYMLIEVPLKAGNLLQTAMDAKKIPADEDNLNSLANAWINARETEKAEATLKRLAAMSDKGEYYYKLGAMYGDEERWKDSKEMLERALQKGGLKKTGEAWMRLGLAAHNLKDTRAAVNALNKAQNYDETRRQASEWLRFISSETAPVTPAESAAGEPAPSAG
ncbi:MAG TPA: tetratricopeptide repeat protein [Nevskiaceae bacterium]|nr:tetratricopeptide repeat protein [Nevskiaceae bacterium]